MTDQLRVFVPLTKIDEEKRLVYGLMTEEAPDKDDEIMDYATSKPHFEAWSSEIAKATDGKSLGNVRVMHTAKAAGKLTDLLFLDPEKRIEVCAKVVDDDEWKMVMEGCYSGFSIGGGYEKRWKDPGNPKLTRYTAKPHEVSLVDNPCLPSAHFTVVKAAGGTEERLFKAAQAPAEPTVEERTMFTKFLGWLLKGAGDAEGLSHSAEDYEDGFSKRDFSTARRKELAGTGAALPDGSYPIVNEQDLKNAIHAYGRAKDKERAKRHIIARAKSLGLTRLLPEGWGASKKGAGLDDGMDAMLKAIADGKPLEDVQTGEADEVSDMLKTVMGDAGASSEEDELEKSMSTIAQMAYSFDSLRNTQRSLLREGHIEQDGGDDAIAKELGEIAQRLAAVIGQKAEHEGAEAVTMTDEADLQFAQYSGVTLPGATKMTKIDENELAKRASKKHHEHVAKAHHHLGKAMEAHKAAMECVAKLAKMHHAHHEAHKAAGEHEFDHGAAAKLIARLHGHHTDTHDHHELAHHHLSLAHATGGATAEHRAGSEHGRTDQGTGRVEDPHQGTEVPEGELKTLLQHIMTEGHVPGLNDGSGPSKAAGGEGSALEQLLKAVQEAGYYKGKAEALEKLPANAGAQPRTFDFGSVPGFNPTNDGTDPRLAAVKKAVGAVDMNDPAQREAAAARVLGTMVGNPGVFAQGMDEGGFRGLAGRK